MKTRLRISSRSLFISALALFVLTSANPALAAERKLMFAVSGVVASVKVKSGDSVKAGTVLAALDQTTFIARKKSAAAATTSAKIIFDQAEVKVSQVRDLFDALSASQEDVDKAETAFANARSAYEAAKSKAEIAHWRLQRSNLKAPFSGTVTSVPGYLGMVVNTYAGSPPIVIVNTP